MDILKIDTEGCEVEILEDLEHRLKYIRIILVEQKISGAFSIL
ncbi:MAG: hypothetical protein GY874_04705 [Desulfobacteraceae bacterium]|nr:hypothetical protein [Desulfobacteraceae bacterium]